MPYIRYSPLIIGMTVVSIGTSLPEIIVSAAASLHGQLDLAVGAALGSNITNILLILGLAALVRPFTVHSDVLRRELPLMLFVSVVAGSVLHDGQLSRSDGIFLLLLAVLWLLFIVKIARLAERQGMTASPANNWRSCRAKAGSRRVLMAGHCAGHHADGDAHGNR